MFEAEVLAPDMLIRLHDLLNVIISSFTKLFSRFHWVPLGSALVLAIVCWFLQRKEHPQGLVAFLFPRSVWLHRSAFLDYRFVLFDKLAIGLLLGMGGWILSGGSQTVKTASKTVLENAVAPSLAIVITYTLTLLLVEDFARYWAHRLMHKAPLLWQFHKVHHSPEVLVPFSQMRTHPVNGLVNVLRSALAIGVVTGLFMLFFPGELTALSIFGVNAGRFVFDLMGSNLRHSHIWFSFGPFLSHILISPAQHQIHHSQERRHIDRNFGSQFAIWDWLFGTLYVPRQRETFLLGIDRAETERMRSIKGLYLEPFKDAAQILRTSNPSPGSRRPRYE